MEKLEGMRRAEDEWNRDDIFSMLQDHGVTTLDRETLDKFSGDDLMRIIVWHCKEGNVADPERVGKACFGNDWEEGKWL